ncbi:hypothetical protein NDU88_004743 [Pleurodeles waltl]|uniref:Uncharacterized protein n=1 Tax=Pleurodeles waltl TaxID=8319 RepID=A0AAV7M979_PLEWA|nr:hypothetical protein NDU88_004743 [Pleurodeles waltl]
MFNLPQRGRHYTSQQSHWAAAAIQDRACGGQKWVDHTVQDSEGSRAQLFLVLRGNPLPAPAVSDRDRERGGYKRRGRQQFEL